MTLSSPAPVLSVGPIVLSVPSRAENLRLRVSVPATGGELPIILLSHGLGPSNHLSSLYGYAPLADFWASHGFAVIQPTHLDSKMLGYGPDAPETRRAWRSRALDMMSILDQLHTIEAAAALPRASLDPRRVAVAGHSMGGHTASLLLGARLTDPDHGTDVDLTEPRIKAGVLLAAPGRGGDALTEFAAQNFPFLSILDFSTMAKPALVVAGTKDDSSHLTVAGADWHTDPYTLSPGRKDLLTLFDAEHGLGGISGYDVAETTDENPRRVAALQRFTWAYLRSELYPGDTAWQTARDNLASRSDPLGELVSK